MASNDAPGAPQAGRASPAPPSGSHPGPRPADLTALRQALAAGHLSARDDVATCLAAARQAPVAPAFLQLDADAALQAAGAADAAQQAARAQPAGAAVIPSLCGVAVSIKDLFDVAGQPTRAASRALADAPPAAADAPAVARLRAAGAVLVGRTHMTEFAFSGIGMNPHHPTPQNAALAALGRPGRIPGGSTSGGAVSVAAGAAWAALGSDTGGSIRIPAALHGLVGFKNTQRLTPTEGSVPLSPSLDTACAITRSVRDAVLLHQVLAARTVHLAGRGLRGLRLGVARSLFQDDLAPAVAAAFESALRTLARHGAQVLDVDLPALARLSDLQAGGGLVAAESWAWHRELITRRGADYDPRVALRIRRGEAFDAAAVRALQAERAAWIERMAADLARVDLMASPTVPIAAPTLADLADDEAFFRANALMLRNPSVVNQLDGCAISLPCQAPGAEPVGLMLWGSGGRDDALLDAAGAAEAALAAA